MRSFESLSFPPDASFTIARARVPLPFLGKGAPVECAIDHDSAILVDIVVEKGLVRHILPAAGRAASAATIDVEGRHVWPTLVDVHTHLDKGHVADRTPNLTGTFEEAKAATTADRTAHWSREDIRRRMEFGLRCAEAHGVSAIRTHLDTYAGHWSTTWDVFEDVRAAWNNRVTLQAVALEPVAMYREDYMRDVIDRVAQTGDLLGGAIRATGDDPGGQLEAIASDIECVFVAARDRDLDIDLHVDECGVPAGAALPLIARAAMRHGYEGRVTCGHCCSLALQDDSVLRETIALVADAGLSIVTLPPVNMYLQDRIAGRTPRWRGVTPVLELRDAGVRVAVAGDNCRDPFYAYGDHDMLDTFRQGVRILHLDHPFGSATAAAGPAPAAIMGLGDHGSIRVGAPADFIIMNARSMDQIVARPHSDRIVIRRGKRLDATLPSYDELEVPTPIESVA